MVGDHLLVDKLSYAPAGPISKHLLPYTEPKRGDVIVFRYPMDITQNYVKRVMGVPGDHIQLVNKDRVSERQGAGRAVRRSTSFRASIRIATIFRGAAVGSGVTIAPRRCWRNNVVNGEAGGSAGISISRWATIATIRSTAATGVSCRAKISSASRW